ncbi:hypothetical protein ZWY2020_030284 [Hordeum vulgare]|nr:hypothetical protein ZWY2020_030284 [Hordeum vulgare]
MEDVVGDLEISGYSSTSISASPSSSLDDGMGLYGWNALSPVADWGMFCSDDGGHDLHGLIESMLCDDTLIGTPEPDEHPDPAITTTTCRRTAIPRRTWLLHLLMAAAEALSGPHKSRELARVILVRLKEMVSSTSGNAAASNMERLAAHFTDALQGLLDGSHSVAGTSRQAASHHHSTGDVLTAFQMLQDMSPYMKFGHFTANQAILEAVAGDRRVHIVDYDLAEGIQWASLMQAMTSRPDGVSPPHLRITAITRSGGAARAVQEAGRRLAAFAGPSGSPSRSDIAV